MRFKNPMNREALALLSKDELIDLVLSLRHGSTNSSAGSA